jgi:multidrug transporter EmrE-like cation transporter
VLQATVFALTAAVLHAGWNLFAKRSGDPFLALWGQFLIAGAVSAVLLVATGGVPAGAWVWAGFSACVHIVYLIALGWAYAHGDFSLAYPLARGGGALLAAIGGIVLLGDDLKLLSVTAIVVVVAGMALLAAGAARAEVWAALIVAATIGAYTLSDSHAARTYDANNYIFATQAASGLTLTLAGISMGRGRDLAAFLSTAWKRTTVAAAMTIAAYGLVLIAVQHAPVGYVAALRESSVLIAVFVGARYLGEERGRTRMIAAALIVGGLVLLVISR